MSEDTTPYYRMRLSTKGLQFENGTPITLDQIRSIIAVLEGQIRITEGLFELDRWLQAAIRFPSSPIKTTGEQ